MGRRPHEPAPSPSEQARAEQALSAKQRSSFGNVGHVGLGKVHADDATPKLDAPLTDDRDGHRTA